MIKLGGLNKICYGITDESGYTNKCVYMLQLYKEHPINIYAILESDSHEGVDIGRLYDGYTQITLDEIYSNTDFGESISISRDLGIFGYESGYYS